MGRTWKKDEGREDEKIAQKGEVNDDMLHNDIRAHRMLRSSDAP
jgi:hypothetical protein